MMKAGLCGVSAAVIDIWGIRALAMVCFSHYTRARSELKQRR
jgi:hypothetical protein